MNIALAPSEIAEFLEQDAQAIPQLWSQKALKRSVYVDYRMNAELSHSSVFDVLEYFVRTDVVEHSDDDAEVETWVSAVDELVEKGQWDDTPMEDLVFELMQIYLDFAGAPCDTTVLAIRATTVLSAYLCLLRFVENDHSILEDRAERRLS